MLLMACVLVLQGGWDEPVRRWVVGWQGFGPARVWAQAAYWAGLGGMQATPLVLLGFWAWRRGRKGTLRWCTAGVGSVAASGLLVQVPKLLVGRPRPRLAMEPWAYFGPTLQSDLHSFPSGHAVTSFALAAGLSAFFPRAAWGFYLTAALIGLGRVVGGSHHLSDVLAGALLGLAVGWPLGMLVHDREVRG